MLYSKDNFVARIPPFLHFYPNTSDTVYFYPMVVPNGGKRVCLNIKNINGAPWEPSYLSFSAPVTGVEHTVSKMFAEMDNIFSNLKNYSRQEIHHISQTQSHM